MRKRRAALLAALLGSVVLHLALIAGSDIGLPELFAPSDIVLARKPPSAIRQVRLAAQKPSVAPRPAHAPTAPAHHRAQQPTTETAAAPAAPPAEATPAPAEPQPAVAPPAEPAPAFPVQIHAVLEAQYNGTPFSIQQTWLMEGLRYRIDLNAARFGFHFRLSSEGTVNPQAGLLPAHYRLLLNDRTRAFADFDDGELRYGQPDAIRNGRLIAAPQDMASLPFHVAVTFHGEPQTLIVTTGNSVYEIRLTADAEELLKLPAGTLRTLHLRGERYDVERGRMQTGYEVWLALDYLNYPVRFVGMTGNGDRLEYRVKALEIEGRRVLDDGAGDAVVASDEVIPAWIREQAMREGLNNH